MIRPFALLLFSITIGRFVAAAEGPSVVLVFSEPDLDSLARRVEAELRSAGHDKVIVEHRSLPGTCSSRPALNGSAGQVGVVLHSEGESDVAAEICVNPQPNQVTVVTARGRLEQKTDFAIVVTEALHGLLIAPISQPKENTKPEPSAEVSDLPSESKQQLPKTLASLSVQSKFALDAATQGYWMGIVPGVVVPFYGNLAFAGELFVGFRPIEYVDEVVQLKSHLVWARFGLLASEKFGPLRLGWDISAGMFSNRATAEAVAPRQGGSDGTFGATFAAGAFAEFPAQGLLYVSGSLGVSTLVPRISYQMPEEVTPEVGALLLEAGLGLGIRFERPRP